MEQSGQHTQWNEWGARVQATLAQLLAPGPPAPLEQEGRPQNTWRKGDATASGKAVGGDANGTSASGSDSALPRETIGWLQTALGATFQTFGTHVDQEFARIETRMDQQQQAVTQVAAVAQDAHTRTTDLDHRISDLYHRMQAPEALPATQVDDCRKAEEAAQNAAAAAARVQEELMNSRRQAEAILHEARSAPAAAPHGCSVVARSGNLGWDTESTVLLQRAKQALETAGIQNEAWDNLVAAVGRSDRGSACEVVFRDAGALATARMQMRARPTTFSPPDRPVWLDAKKTRQELRPARQVHRAAECLKDLGTSRHQMQDNLFEKNMLRRTVNYNGHMLAFVSGSQLKCANKAGDWFTDEELELCSGYANAD